LFSNIARLRFASQKSFCATVIFPVECFSSNGKQCLNQGTARAVSAGRNVGVFKAGRGSTDTADKHLVRRCPFLTMVPVMAVSDLVAVR